MSDKQKVTVVRPKTMKQLIAELSKPHPGGVKQIRIGGIKFDAPEPPTPEEQEAIKKFVKRITVFVGDPEAARVPLCKTIKPEGDAP